MHIYTQKEMWKADDTSTRHWTVCALVKLADVVH